MKNQKISIILGIGLLVFSIILGSISIEYAFNLQEKRLAYFENEEIYRDPFSVISFDGINIEGFIYVDDSLSVKNDHSIPTILMLHGINNRKEGHIDKIYQFVKRGYAIISVEERGHGESGGISGFLGKEPQDMMKVIDYIQSNYAFCDTNRIGLYAFSYGGGVATILQAIDDRIYVSVIYHPLSTIDGFTEGIPIQRLLGSTIAINNVDDIQDAYDACTPENTKNMLLIHGDQDTVIKPEFSQGLYELVNGEFRDDIDLEIRPGLDHGPNERDPTSLKHTLIWFEHFYHDPSINIVNRESLISSIELYDDNYPEGASESNDLIWYASVIFFVGLFFLLYPTFLWSFSKEREGINPFTVKVGTSEAYNKMLILRSVAYILVALGGSIFFFFVNKSFIYGYCVFIPLATIIVMLLIPSSNFPNWKAEWNDWHDKKAITFVFSVLLILIPILSYVLVYNLNAKIMIESPIPFFTTTILTYLSIGIGLIYADLLLIRGWKFKHTLLLMILRPITFVIFFLLIPIPPFTYIGDALANMLYILIACLIGIILWLIIFFIRSMKIVFRNNFAVSLIIFLPLLVFLTYRFFRIV